MIKFPVSKPQTVQTHKEEEPYPSNFENVREPAHPSLAQKIENDDKILKIFILEPKCTCQMGANPNDPKLEQTSCTLQPNGPGWPYELLLHPLVPKRISVPEFYLSCGGPPCQCSGGEQINFICDDQNCDEQIKIEGKNILINPAVMTQNTTQLLFIAQIPDGQQFMVQQMKLRLVDPICPPELFQDFDGNLMAIDDLPHIINLPLRNPDKSQPSQCGQPTITTQDKCLVLQQSDDLLAVTYNISACNHLGVHESQLQIQFDQFYNAVSTVNLKYQFQCVPKLELREASLKDFYFDQLLSNTDQGMTIEVGLWQADTECSTPFNQRLQIPPGLMQWYSYDEIKQTVHIFGYPDDSSISQVVFELQALVENTVVKSSTTTINFSRNQVTQKRRLQSTFPDNRQVSPTAPTLTYTCKKVSDGTACTNARVQLGTEANVYDNNGDTWWELISNDANTKWAITETYTKPVTVKAVISRMAFCSTTNPCRIYIGNSADYTQNTQCGADQTVSANWNMFTCNLQGIYVTSELYSLSSQAIHRNVFLYQNVHFANSIIPKSAMLAETSNCVTAGQLTKINGATSLGDLIASPRQYVWNVPSGCSGANPYIKNKLDFPYVIQGVYLIKQKSPAAQSSPIEVLVDGVSCGTLTDKNQVTSTIPIQRLKCNQPLAGTEITFRYTTNIVTNEKWYIAAIFGDRLNCNSGNSMIAPSIPARTVDQTQTTAYIDAFPDYASGTTNPPVCGARTCSSNHPNVLWDNNFQRFEVKSLGDADFPGNFNVMLSCFLTNYPTIPVSSSSFVLTIAPKAVKFKCESNGSIKTIVGNYGQWFFDQGQNNTNFTIISIQSFEAFVNNSILFVRSQNSSDIGQQQLTILQTNNANQCNFTVSVLFKNQTSQLAQSAQNLNQTQDQIKDNILNQTNNQSQIDEVNEGFLDYQQDWKAAYQDTLGNKVANQTSPDVFIQSIDQNGTVKLRFTQQMIIPKIANVLDQLQGNQISQRMLNQTSAPALTLKVIPAKGQSQKNLNFSYNITSYTQKSMTIELNFLNALEISSQEEADWLQIEFTNNKYFFDKYGKFIIKNKVVQYRLPRQMTKGKTTQLIKETAEIILTSTVVVMTSFVALNILLSASLNMLMSIVDSLQLILMMCLWNISIPPITSFNLGFIQKIANFDIIPTDDIWNYFFPEIPKSYQIHKKFQQLGYDSEHFLFNIGTFLFSFGAYLLIVVLNFMLKCLSNRFSRIKSFYEKVNSFTFYSYPITLLTESFLSVGLCAMINFKNIQFDNKGEFLSSMLAIVFSIISFSFPLLMIFYLWKNFKTIENLKCKFGSFYQEFYLSRGPKVFLLKMNYFVRRLVVAYSVVYMSNIVFQMYSMYLFVFIQTILIFYVRPFEEGRFKMYTEMFNEIMIILTSYTIISFSAWVSDINTQEIMGYVTLIVIGLHLLVNLGLMLFKNVNQLWLIFKKYVVYRIQKNIAYQKFIKELKKKLASQKSKNSELPVQQVQQGGPQNQNEPEIQANSPGTPIPRPSNSNLSSYYGSESEQQEEQKQQDNKKDDLEPEILQVSSIDRNEQETRIQQIEQEQIVQKTNQNLKSPQRAKRFTKISQDNQIAAEQYTEDYIQQRLRQIMTMQRPKVMINSEKPNVITKSQQPNVIMSKKPNDIMSKKPIN